MLCFGILFFNLIDLRETGDFEMLFHATTSVLKKEHKHDVSKALVAAASSTKNVLCALKRKVPVPFNPEEALSLFIVKGNQTKSQYLTMRLASRWKGKCVIFLNKTMH